MPTIAVRIPRKELHCKDCQQEFPEFYMIQNRLWKEIGVGKEVLCIRCLNLRCLHKTGRPLRIKDFKRHTPVNELLFFGYFLGRAEEKETLF